MGDLILSAGLFTGEAIEEFIVINTDAVEAKKEDPRGAYFNILPVKADWDVTFTQKRGQDEQNIRFRLDQNRQSDDDSPNVQFETMERTFSNTKETAALKWLFCKVVTGWRDIKLSNGELLPYNEQNREILGSVPSISKPVIERAYANAGVLEEAAEGNLTTSSDGKPIQD